MPTKRICDTALDAVADIPDGATLLVHSFGPPQAWPVDCLNALAERGVRDLTVVCNTPAGGPTSLNILAEKQQIRRLICSYVTNPAFQTPIGDQVAAGEIELEMVPQGTLVERVRAGGAGLAGFYTPTGVGTAAAEGKEVREFDGRPHVFERAIRADYRAAAGAPRRRGGQPRLPRRHAELRAGLRDGRAARPSPRCARSSPWARSTRRPS